MAGFARIATQLGHQVTGADANVYPPMSNVLAALGIPVHEGYGPESLSPHPDLVLIGNALSRGNPAVEAVLNLGIPYTSGPEWLGREVLFGRRVIAVSGTHGKTTTTALIAHILNEAGLTPGFMVGGQVPDLGATAELGAGTFFVIEADEYDTAFFDKRSKFLHYHPECLIINNLEFDHADIFPDLAAIETQFHHGVRTVPGNGCILANATGDAVDRVLERGVWSPVWRFGVSPSADIRCHPGEICHSDGQADGPTAPRGPVRQRFTVSVNHPSLGEAIDLELVSSLPGQFSRENIAAAIGASLLAGVPPATICRAVGNFNGVARRLQCIYSGPASHPLRVYDDFAHHPTAIAATLQGLRAAYPDDRILVVLEPRSNTMRMGVHRGRLIEALAAADAAMVLLPPELGWSLDGRPTPHDGRPTLSVYPGIRPLTDAILHQASGFDHIVLMSNGAFGGLPQTLPALLSRQFSNSGNSAPDAEPR